MSGFKYVMCNCNVRRFEWVTDGAPKTCPRLIFQRSSRSCSQRYWRYSLRKPFLCFVYSLLFNGVRPIFIGQGGLAGDTKSDEYRIRIKATKRYRSPGFSSGDNSSHVAMNRKGQHMKRRFDKVIVLKETCEMFFLTLLFSNNPTQLYATY